MNSKISGAILALVFIFSPAPVHAKGWLRSACERLLGSPGREVSPEAQMAMNTWRSAASRINSYWRHFFAVHWGESGFISGAQPTIEIEIKTPDGSPRSDVKILVNPASVNCAWDVLSTETHCPGPLAVILFKDSEVHDSHRGHHLMSTFMKDELEYIQQKSRGGLSLELKMQMAEKFSGISLSSQARGYTVAWVEGAIAPIQLAKTLMLMIQNAAKSSPSAAD